MTRPSDSRERLLETAHRLVWEHSYGGVGIDAICREAKVNKGSFYHFFPSKAALVGAALEAHFDRLRPVFDDAFSATRAPLERLRAWFALLEQSQCALREEHGHTLGCPLAACGGELATQEPELAGQVQKLMARNRRYVETAVRDAQADGSIRTDVPGALLAGALFTYVEGVLVEARIHDDPAIGGKLEAGARLILGLPPEQKKN